MTSKKDKILELAKLGYSTSEIAEKLNTRYQYVYTVLIMNGLHKPTAKDRSGVPKWLREREEKIRRARANKVRMARISPVSGTEFVRKYGILVNPKCKYLDSKTGKCRYKKDCEFQVIRNGEICCAKIVNR